MWRSGKDQTIFGQKSKNVKSQIFLLCFKHAVSAVVQQQNEIKTFVCTCVYYAVGGQYERVLVFF